VKKALALAICSSTWMICMSTAVVPVYAQSVNITDGGALRQLLEQTRLRYEIVSGVEADTDSIFVVGTEQDKTAVKKNIDYGWNRHSVFGKGGKGLKALLTLSNGMIDALYRTGENETSISRVGRELESTTALHKTNDGTIAFTIDFFKNGAPSFLLYTLNSGCGAGERVSVTGSIDARGNSMGPLTYIGNRDIELVRTFQTLHENVSIRETFRGKDRVIKQDGFTKLVQLAPDTTALPAYAATNLSVMHGSSGLVLVEKPVTKNQPRPRKGTVESLTIKYSQQPDGRFVSEGELRIKK
jgi:hypothetical protein